jgi:hypothetical protein
LYLLAILQAAVAPLPHFLEEEEEEEEVHKASGGNQEVEEGEHGLQPMWMDD